MKVLTDISNETYSKVSLLAQAWGVNNDEVIKRLLESFQTPNPKDAPYSQDHGVAIHVIFEKSRTEALYDPATKSLTIVNGPLKGKSFSTPSGAASAVIRQYRPDISPNRNGWSFWTISENGNLLQSIR